MINKISKISLVFGALFAGLSVAASLLYEFKELEWFSDSVRYSLFTLMLLGSVLVSHLVALAICLIIKKIDAVRQRRSGLDTQSPKDPPQPLPNRIGVFFKTYFYFWTVLSIIVFVCGSIFSNSFVEVASHIIIINFFAMGAAWLLVVFFSVMIWATVSAWKAAKLTSIIFGFIAFFLFGLISLCGILYFDDAKYYQQYYAYQTYDDYDFQDSEVIETQERAQETDNYNPASETDMDRAFSFLRYKMGLDKEQHAMQLVGNWTGSWKDDAFGQYDSRNYFQSLSHFQQSQSNFYTLINRGMGSNSVLTSIADFYRNSWGERRRTLLSRNAFVNSGASDCLKVLMWVYDDIYSKEDHEDVLREIYDFMADEKNLSTNYFEGLSHIIDTEVYDKILTMASRDVDYAMEWAATGLSVWAYSFWARRYNDSVDGTVYSILKIIEGIYM